ncbi:hypothetical protein JOD20_001445 [Herpetosiphon giganteus]|nr:hypothetical protein [Herpetosiphon giganteus]
MCIGSLDWQPCSLTPQPPLPLDAGEGEHPFVTECSRTTA